MSRLDEIEIDPRSIVATVLQVDLLTLARSDKLAGDELASALLLAIARLEARIFNEIDPPIQWR